MNRALTPLKTSCLSFQSLLPFMLEIFNFLKGYFRNLLRVAVAFKRYQLLLTCVMTKFQKAQQV